MASENDYLLRLELEGHEKAVRTVCTLPVTQRIVTGSMDGTVFVWDMVNPSNAKPDSGGSTDTNDTSVERSPVTYFPYRQLTHHVRFVYIVAPSSDVDREGASSDTEKDTSFLSQNQSFYTGGMDQKAYRVSVNGDIISTFVGHSGAVTGLCEMSTKRQLLSGSWDGSARIWDTSTSACMHVLSGHSHAVCLSVMSNDIILTASQDKVIRFWNEDKCYNKIDNAHTDIIRALCEVTGIPPETDNTAAWHFASVSNDGTLKLWTGTGASLLTLTGHDSFVFNVFASSVFSGRVFTASEDRTVRVWDMHTGKEIQCILHGAGVWQVAELSDGDIVTACEDHVSRLWTTRPAVALPSSLREQKAAEVKKIHEEDERRAATESINVANLPNVSQITSIRGTKIGQTKLFAEGDLAIAYSWTGTSWDRIGDVIAAGPNGKTASGRPISNNGPQSGNLIKRYYDGDKYFSGGMYDYIFDIEVDEHQRGEPHKKLPFNCTDNLLVAAEKFCARENISKTNIQQITTFIQQNSNSSVSTGQSTAASSAVMSTHPSTTAGGSRHFHANLVPLTFKKIGNLTPMYTKFLEYNELLSKRGDVDNELTFTANEKLYLKDALDRIGSPTWLREDFRVCQISLIFKKLLMWPKECFVPVVDLWRIMVLHEQSTDIQRHAEDGWNCIRKALHLLHEASSDNAAGNDPSASLLPTCCVRYFANLFEYPSNRQSLFRHKTQVFASLFGTGVFVQPTVHIGVATIALNFAIVLRDSKEENVKQDRQQTLNLVIQLLAAETAPEAYYRELVAFGCLLSQDPVSMIPLAKEYRAFEALPPINVRWHGPNVEQRIVECAKELNAFHA